MSRVMLVVLAVLLSATVSATVVFAQEAAELANKASKAEKSEQSGGVSGPIVITSDTLRADGRKGTATFIGSVVAIGDDLYMTAERMKVFYAAGGGDLDRIEADGSVKLIREGRIITSERAVYEAQGRKMTFTENARVVEDGNVLVGTKITYMIDGDRYDVQDSKIFIEKTSSGSGSR